jgi:hypothetical protein
VSPKGSSAYPAAAMGRWVRMRSMASARRHPRQSSRRRQPNVSGYAMWQRSSTPQPGRRGRHADSGTTRSKDRRRQDVDKHGACVVVAFVRGVAPGMDRERV